MLEVRQRQAQIVSYLARRRKERVALHVFLQCPARELEHRLQLRVLGRTKAADFGQRRRIRSEQAIEPAEARQRVAPKIDRRSSGRAGAQEHCEQFGVR